MAARGGVAVSGVDVDVEAVGVGVGVGVVFFALGTGAVRYPSNEMTVPPIVTAFGSVFVFLLFAGGAELFSAAIMSLYCSKVC